MKQKLSDVQGLRAIAALAVVVFHSTAWLPGGFLGVDVFFVISGFIVARLSIEEIEATGTFASIRFLRHRLVRVVPPMAAVVLVTLLLFSAIDTPTHLIRDLPAAAFAALTGWINVYFTTYATDYFQTFQSNPLLHLWSLSIEMQFYLAFALAAKLGSKVGLAAVSSLVTVASLVVALGIRHAGIALPEVASFFLLPTRLWEFGLGILVARPWTTRIVDPLQIAAAILLFVGLAFGSSTQLVPGTQALAPCVGTAVLLATSGRGTISRILSCPPLVYFGDRSYSIYLWQGPLIVLAAILFATPLALMSAAVLSILISAISYRTVEQLFRLSKRWLAFSSAWTASALACAAIYFAVPVAVGRFEAPKGLRATFLDDKCERQRGSLGINPCVYGPSDLPKVLLIGDSHAGAISQAVVDAAASAGWQALVATASACSVPEYPEDVVFRPSCAGYTANVVRYAKEQSVRLIILEQFSEYYVNELGISLDRWRDGLSGLLSEMNRADIRTLVIGNNLRLPLAVGRPIWANTWRVDLGAEINRRAALDDVERGAASSSPLGSYLAARDVLCDGRWCPVFDNGAWQYTDNDHLSDRGATPLVKPIVKILAEAAERAGR